MSAELLAGCAVLDREGLTTAFGHLSVRDGDGMLISHSKGPGLVRSEDDLLPVAPNGDGPDGVPGEAAIHLGVYRARPPVGSVCRFHGPACLAWGTLNRPLPAATGMGLFVGAMVPCHDTASTIRDADDADALAATLGNGPAVLLRGFGAVTVGATPAEAVARAWLMERNAAAVLAAFAVDDPVPYEPADAAQLTRPGGPAAAQLARLFHYLTERTAA